MTRSALQPVPRQRILYLSDRTGPWWAGVPNRCTPACGGPLYLVPPGTWSAVPAPGSISCGRCGLTVRNVDILDVRRAPVEFEPFPPPRVRAPGAPQPPRVCAAEGCTALTGRQRKRCNPCAAAYRLRVTQPDRLLRLLAHGEIVSHRELRVKLNVSDDGLRKIVKSARKRGAPITACGWGFRLEVKA